MRRHLDTLKRLTEAEGRDFSALTISYEAPLCITGVRSADGSRRPFSGVPEEIAAEIRTFAAIGVYQLVFDCRVGSPRRTSCACKGAPPVSSRRVYRVSLRCPTEAASRATGTAPRP
jgi:hypothetical protein